MFKRLAVLCTVVMASAGLGSAEGASQSGDYIVVLKSGSDSAAVASKHKQKHGAELSFVYKHALKGYAAKLSAKAFAAVAADPEVLSISEDGIVEGFQAQPPQVVSNAVLRIDGDESSTRSGDGSGSVNVNIAVLDDGMDASHPDLNVVGSTSCVNGRRRDKQSPPGWHGTMVGGFIAALDNGIGRVGVAPGARLWAVQVLGGNGFGTNSEVICGLDWVVGTRTDSNPANDIAVVNMSLGGKNKHDSGGCPASPNDALYVAVCRVVAAGPVIVAAAGNEATDFRGDWPATNDDVLAVTAMGDRDGQPGGLGGQFNCDPSFFDDVAAHFSNFATLPEDQAHTVSAPGVCDASTFPGGLYAVGSGTSFSTPLVAGTVALCIASGACANLPSAQIVSKIVADAAGYNQANPSYGFQGDPLRPISGKYYGYLVRAGLY